MQAYKCEVRNSTLAFAQGELFRPNLLKQQLDNWLLCDDVIAPKDVQISPFSFCKRVTQAFTSECSQRRLFY